MNIEAGLFFGLWLRKPLQIAAISPSSRHLADAFAELVDLRRPGRVLELGGGTGSLTRGLLRAACPASRLVVLEREAALAALLRREFPEVVVIEGDATRIGEYLDEWRIERLTAVVSSLPIKWFPTDAQRAVLLPCLERLAPGGVFLQVTNGFCSPVRIDKLGIAGHEAQRVWRNLPPAQIWAYSQT
ncbi:MAG TPA: methyltransferase domain-containing protein [Stellaceae bacterium]|jgi:phosphatidylethanolamine/phosphatidyl-N-methylethanolamine N-methyltransferase|nr:methyltransferase domain-containing protein [Stellaceae bacterium]